MFRLFRPVRSHYLGISALVLASAASFTSPAVYATGTSSSQPVTVFRDIKFRGRSLSTGQGEISIRDLRRSRVGNDRISSIRIEPGYEVQACQRSRLRGRCETFTNSIADLRTIHFNDVISSLTVTRISASPVTLFRDRNFRGRSLSVGEGIVSFRDLRTSSVGNNRISSIDIAAGYEVLACGLSRLRGRCETLTNPTADLRTISFNNVISSLRVRLIPEEPVNTPPVVSNITFNTLATNPVTISLAELSSVVSDADGDSLSLIIDSDLVTDNGSSFTFDPSVDFANLLQGETGSVNFDFTVSDGIAESTAMITIVVEGTAVAPQVNTPPAVSDITLTTDADTPLDISLADFNSVVSDVDGDVLSLILTGDSVTGGPTTFTFDPTVDFADLLVGETGSTSFNYTISDGSAQSTATLTIVVTGTAVPPPPPPVNTPPVVSDITFNTNANTPVSISLADLSGVVSDADGDALFLTINSNMVTNNGGIFTFDPSVNFSNLLVGSTQSVEFEYTVSDGQAQSTAAITIVITGTALQTFNIGDTGPAGGTVFAVSDGGTRGLEFAPQYIQDASPLIDGIQPITWGCFGTNIDTIPDLQGFNGVGQPVNPVQSGFVNAGALLNASCNPVAALEALGYSTSTPQTNFGDWYLPSITELILIRELFGGLALPEQTSGNMAVLNTLRIWSSTEHTNDLVWTLQTTSDPSLPPAGIPSKNSLDGISVLPVRSF